MTGIGPGAPVAGRGADSAPPATPQSVGTGVLELADLVAEALARANHAAVAIDLDAAQTVVEGDHAVDELAHRLEEQGDELLRRAGGGPDVDELVAALHLVTELALVGDLAVDVAKTARRLYRSTRSPRLTGLVEKAGEDALGLFHLAVAAYGGTGADPAEACRRMEGQLEDLSTAFVQTVLDASRTAEGPDLQVCVQVALLGRAYERIGHHATTIAEWAYFRAHGSAPPPIATTSFARRARAEARRPPAGPGAPPADGAGAPDGPPGAPA